MHALDGMDILAAQMVLVVSKGGLLVITELSLLVVGDNIITSLLGPIGGEISTLATFWPYDGTLRVGSFGINKGEGEWARVEGATIGVPWE